MPYRKRHQQEVERLRELHERAELIRRRSSDLIQQMEKLAAEIARQTARVQNQPGPNARKPR
jgi:hypothetical protein